MFKTQQTEDFKISDNVLYNLSSNEKLLYKLKIKYYTRMEKFYRLASVFILLCNIILIFLLLNPDFISNDTLVKLSIIVILPLSVIFFYKMSKSLEFYIYFSNMKFYIIHEKSPLNYAIDIIELSSLQCISINYKDSRRDIGKIEFTSHRFDNYRNLTKKKSIITPYIKNASKLFQIFESILWFFGDGQKRLEIINSNGSSQNYHVFYHSNQNDSIKIYGNKVIFINGNKEQAIEFKDVFTLLYESKNLIITLSEERLKNLIKFGPFENFLEILELLYLKFLNWKLNEELLLDFKEILNLQKKESIQSLDERKIKSLYKLKSTNFSKNDFMPFCEYIGEDEEILLNYFSREFFKFIFSIVISSLSFVYLFFVVFSYINLNQSNIIIFFGFFLIVLILITSLQLKKPVRYVFTSQKFIRQNKKKILCIQYNEINAITHIDKLRGQEIQIHLKKPIKDTEIGEINKIIFNSLKKSDIFMKILNIRRSYYNNK